GLLFAPVYIERAVMARPAFVYTPNVVLNVSLIADHLFARPGYGHYYFGDYYAPEYRRVGIIPVHAFHQVRGGYSPIYAHRLAVHRRTDPGWEQRYIRDFELRQRRADARRPRTWAALRQAIDGRGRDG